MYLTGESYAGHYIPFFADYLFHNPIAGVKLGGVAIGNGWVDPFYQYQEYPTYALENNIIDNGQYYLLEYGLNYLCALSMMLEFPLLSTSLCSFEMATIMGASIWPIFNLYDIRKACVSMGLCYPDDGLETLFNSKQT